MRVISVSQPWAQLIVDRRRHVIIKNDTWTGVVQSGERYAIHASHLINRKKCKEFEYNPDSLQKNAILGVIEVKRCFPRLSARPSKFDYHSESVKQESLIAIVVRTVEKYRKPIEVMQPLFIKGKYWEF